MHAMDIFHRLCGQAPFRCRECRNRFYGPRTATREMKRSGRFIRSGRRSRSYESGLKRERVRRRAMYLAILAVIFLIFWFFLRYIATL